MSERDHGERPAPGPGRRRPSRRMRERADEMADLLAHAAPAVRAHRMRRTAAIPAAVLALGALTVGGVGVAVGLDAEPARALVLPDPPAEGGDPGGAPAAPDGASVTTSSVVTDVTTDDPGDGDDSDDRDSAAVGRVAEGRAPAAASAPRRPARTTTTSGDADDDEPRSTPATRPSRSSRTTTTSPTTSSTEEREASDGDASDPTTRSGRSALDRGTDLRAGSTAGSILPSRSPTGDDE